jgi:1,2-diacylglycerol 3-alpha-glucosyltransferase
VRIGILADLYSPHVSGITVFVSMYQKTLESLGHEAHVFTFGPAGYPNRDPRIHRTAGVAVGKTGFYFAPGHNSRNRASLRSMDLLHTMHPFVSGTLAFRYRRDPSTPVVFTSQTRYDLYIRHYLPRVAWGAARRMLRIYMQRFCRRCALVIAPSASGAGMLRDLGVTGGIAIIPNAVDLELFQSPSPAEKFTRDRIRAVYVGRLSAEKNLPFLLRAISLALPACPKLELALIGDGPDRKPLEALAANLRIADRVTFLGEMPHHELPSLLGNCDLFLTASVTEVHPLSLIEAMAAGLPVVAIATGGISETVEDGVSGLLSADSPEDYAEKIRRVIRDPALGRTLAAGAVRAVQPYGIRFVVQRHLERFVSLLPKERAAHGVGK